LRRQLDGAARLLESTARASRSAAQGMLDTALVSRDQRRALAAFDPGNTRVMLIRLTPLDLRRALSSGRHGTEFSTPGSPVLSGRGTGLRRRSGAAGWRTLAIALVP